MQNKESVRQAEMSVIGGVLIDSKILAKVVDKVKDIDFYVGDLRAVYKTILNVSNSGKAVDYITVFNELSGLKDISLDQNELRKLLITCCEVTPSTQNVECYAEIVHKSAVARSIEQSLLSVLSDGLESETVAEQTEKFN